MGVILNDYAQAGLPPGPIITDFVGKAVNQNDILLKYTYFGDADLSGVVDGLDYFLVDNGFGAGIVNGGWLNGDFDYSGSIDGLDYFLIDNAFGSQGAPLNGALISDNIAVPEPSVAGVMAVAVGMLTACQRKWTRNKA